MDTTIDPNEFDVYRVLAQPFLSHWGGEWRAVQESAATSMIAQFQEVFERQRAVSERARNELEAWLKKWPPDPQASDTLLRWHFKQRLHVLEQTGYPETKVVAALGLFAAWQWLCARSQPAEHKAGWSAQILELKEVLKLLEAIDAFKAKLPAERALAQSDLRKDIARRGGQARGAKKQSLKPLAWAQIEKLLNRGTKRYGKFSNLDELFAEAHDMIFRELCKTRDSQAAEKLAPKASTLNSWFATELRRSRAA